MIYLVITRPAVASGLALLLAIGSLPLTAAEPGDNAQPRFTLDENIWVTFYDVPSRRFRAVRDKFVRGDFQGAAHDLRTSTGFLRVEANRAAPELQEPMNELIGQLDSIIERIDGQSVTANQLDSVFGRAHWLLAQHFLVQAQQSRDRGQHVNAGHYLWATAHHLERAVLWSGARIDKKLLTSLESIRALSVRLQKSKTPERVYRDRPIRLTAQTLITVGAHIDRKVRIESALQPVLAD